MRPLLVPAAVALAVQLAGCGLPDGDYFGKIPTPDPTHFRLCGAGEPEYLDPALASSTTDLKIIYATFDSLTDHDEKGLPAPSIATSWDISDDQRTFTFHLRDDARWSNGRPITAADFAYHIVRVLHPATGSKNAENHWRLKNGQLFSAGRVKEVLHDVAGFHHGDVVEIVGLGGQVADDPGAVDLPDSNLRTSREPLALRDLGAPTASAYATVPAGKPVTIIELGGAARDWAYVFFDEDDGVYGWVPVADLDGQPNAAVAYTVRAVGPEHRVGVSLPPAPPGTVQPTAVITGADLLMLPDVLGLRVPDDHTLVLETWGPVPFMIDLTPQRSFRATPREVVSRWPKRWVYPEHIVTSGAFHLSEWIQRDHVTLVKSPTFWDHDNVRLDRITVYAMDDQAANANFYLQGSCDAVSSNNIPASYLPVMTRRKYKDFHLDPFLGIYYYLINTKKLSNVHLRRAINFAVDRTPIPNITRGFEIPTAQYMPGTPIARLSDEDLALCGVTRDQKGVASIVVRGKVCYVTPPGLDYDPDQLAKELALAHAELGDAFPRTLTIKFNSGVEAHKLIAEWMQQQLEHALGIHIELETQEWKTFLKDTANGEYDIARMGGIGNFPDPEAEFLSDFKCGNPNNRPMYCSAEYDRLMKQAEGIADRKERLAVVRQAESVLMADAPLIPLYVYTQKSLIKPYVRGYDINLTDKPNFKRVWIDPDWRQAEAP